MSVKDFPIKGMKNRQGSAKANTYRVGSERVTRNGFREPVRRTKKQQEASLPGDATAQFNLDIAHATVAAHADAQFKVAVAYYTGEEEGIGQDYEEAVKWFRRAYVELERLRCGVCECCDPQQEVG
jgi:hypothetical protein